MAETRYTKSHEWARLEDGVVTIGVTQHAVDELKDLTFLDYRVEADESIKQGDVFGEIDAVKATSELFAPVSGTVLALNEALEDGSELGVLSTSPEGEGWLIKLRPDDASELEQLFTAAEYAAHCE